MTAGSIPSNWRIWRSLSSPGRQALAAANSTACAGCCAKWLKVTRPGCVVGPWRRKVGKLLTDFGEVRARAVLERIGSQLMRPGCRNGVRAMPAEDFDLRAIHR